ncbi:MAG TPA: hypothetical protein VMF61_17345 [Candidatus Acidoferrales bacterium]|nr:hypothetical protein [Candidatus Acidoferrales bacterium]
MNATVTRTTLALAAWAGLASAAIPAAASDKTAPNASSPVARVSLVQQAIVSIVRADGTQVGDADTGTPLRAGDRVTVAGPHALVELRIGDRAALRIAGDADLTVAQAPAGTAPKLDVADGVTELALVRGGGSGVSVVTPNVTADSSYAGNYRIAVDAHGTTTVTVRDGQLHVAAGGRSYSLLAGNGMIARAQSPAGVSMVAAPGADAFDAFNRDRDAQLVSSLQGDDYSESLAVAPGGAGAAGGAARWALPASYGSEGFSVERGSAALADDASADPTATNGQWVYSPQYGWYWNPSSGLGMGMGFFPGLGMGYPFGGFAPLGYYGYPGYVQTGRITPPPEHTGKTAWYGPVLREALRPALLTGDRLVPRPALGQLGLHHPTPLIEVPESRIITTPMRMGRPPGT